MKRLFKACGSIWSLIMLLALSGPAMAATYTGIDCPDSIYTDARAINDRGDIVGNCEDASGIHGFRLRKGVFELIDFPGASTTFATGTNNLGHVVGWYEDSGQQRTDLCSAMAASRRSIRPGRSIRLPKVSTISEGSSVSMGIATA